MTTKSATGLLCPLALLVLFTASRAEHQTTVRQTGAWAACTGVDGVCIDTSVYSCSSDTLFDKCPGGANIRCCAYPAGVTAGDCHAERLGRCTRSENCPRAVITDKCPGPHGITCCPHGPPSIAPPTSAPTTRAPTTGATGAPPPSSDGDSASGTSCELYRRISGRGLRICTNVCRDFRINTRLPGPLGGELLEKAKARAYLHNAFCACSVTPDGAADSKAYVVRRCLQRRLLEASRGGKTVWTPGEIEQDHKMCYREADCPCGPAFSFAWEIVTAVPDPFACGANDLGIGLFGNCRSCSVSVPQNGPPVTYRTCFPCPNF